MYTISCKIVQHSIEERTYARKQRLVTYNCTEPPEEYALNLEYVRSNNKYCGQETGNEIIFILVSLTWHE